MIEKKTTKKAPAKKTAPKKAPEVKEVPQPEQKPLKRQFWERVIENARKV